MMSYTLAKESHDDETCKESLTVALTPEDKEAMKQNPLETITAQLVQEKNLVPVRIITFFMSPHAPEAINSIPINIMMIFEQAVNKYSASQQTNGPNYSLLKPTAAQFVGAPPPHDEEEEEGEGEGEGEDEHADDVEGDMGNAEELKASKKK
ncbi:hypothetical protein COBT_001718 [Conglomerata obtusa]